MFHRANVLGPDPDWMLESASVEPYGEVHLSSIWLWLRAQSVSRLGPMHGV